MQVFKFLCLILFLGPLANAYPNDCTEIILALSNQRTLSRVHELEPAMISLIEGVTRDQQELKQILQQYIARSIDERTVETRVNRMLRDNDIDLRVYLGIEPAEIIARDYIQRGLIQNESHISIDQATGYIHPELWTLMLNNGIFLVTDSHDLITHIPQFFIPRFLETLTLYKTAELSLSRNSSLINEELLSIIKTNLRNSTYENMAYLNDHGHGNIQMIYLGINSQIFNQAIARYRASGSSEKRRILHSIVDQLLLSDINDFKNSALRIINHDNLSNERIMIIERFLNLESITKTIRIYNDHKLQLYEQLETILNDTDNVDHITHRITAYLSSEECNDLFNLEFRMRLFSDTSYFINSLRRTL